MGYPNLIKPQQYIQYWQINMTIKRHSEAWNGMCSCIVNYVEVRKLLLRRVLDLREASDHGVEPEGNAAHRAVIPILLHVQRHLLF